MPYCRTDSEHSFSVCIQILFAFIFCYFFCLRESFWRHLRLCEIARSGIYNSIGVAKWMLIARRLEMIQMQMKSKKFFSSSCAFYYLRNSFKNVSHLLLYTRWLHIKLVSDAQSSKCDAMPFIRYEFVSSNRKYNKNWAESEGEVAQANNCKMEWRVIKIYIERKWKCGLWCVDVTAK